MERLFGRVAVVTGAASGIGRALAERLAAEGMKLALADLEEAPLRALARSLEARGAQTLALAADVSREGDLRHLAERSLAAFGAVHLLCNNAGVFAGGLSWQLPLEDYEWVLGVNFWGVLNCLRAFVPILLEQDEGHVLNVASMAALTVAPFCAPYTVSKHAVMALSETLYLEMRARGARVGVSVLCPELVATRIGDSERNRPERWRREGGSHAERDLVEAALRQSTQAGLAPEALAGRAVEAIREGRLYALAPEGDPWRRACEARLEALRAARNPGMEISGAG